MKTLDLRGRIQLQLTLAIAQQQVTVNVSGKTLAFANSDPLYRELCNVALGQTYRFDNFTLNYDVGTFQFRKGTLTVLNPVNGVETGAIFIGEGHFNLKAMLRLDAHELERRTGSAEAKEDFTQVVFRFTREAWMKFLPGLGEQIGTPAEAGVVLSHWRGRVRERREHPLGFSQYLLQGEAMDNVDADLMAPSTIPCIRHFLMPTSAARSIRTSVSSCEIVWGRCPSLIHQKRSRSSTTIPKEWMTASGICLT